MIEGKTYHPKLMNIIAHYHTPMLTWVGIVAYSVLDLVSGYRLGEPLACRTCDWMPAQFHGPWLSADVCLSWWYDIGLMAEPDRFLEVASSFCDRPFAFVEAFLAVRVLC